MALHIDEPPSGAYQWDVFLSCRKSESGPEHELCHNLYLALTDKSLRVFWEPVCLPATLTLGKRDRELKYITAAANSVVALLIISRSSFNTRDRDVAKYVWSSHPDELLMEWDLLFELFEQGRVQRVLPVLVGDLLNSNYLKMQERVMSKLGIVSLDEANVVARVREIFKFTDADKSGFIDKNELRTTFKRFGLVITEEELDDYMAEFDGDEDAGMDVFEFEDLIVNMLERKCGVTINRVSKQVSKVSGSSASKQAKDGSNSTSTLGSSNLAQKSSGTSGGGESPEGRGTVRDEKSQVSLLAEVAEGEEGEESAAAGEEEDGEKIQVGVLSEAMLRIQTREQQQGQGPARGEDDEDAANPEQGREFFANFWDSECVPRLPPVIVVAAMRKVTLWMVHDLLFQVTPVLWREPHMRAVPGLDGEGRTVQQTVNLVLKYPNPHLCIGMKSGAVAHIVIRAMKEWTECVGIRAQRSTRTKDGKRAVRELLCFNTRQPAKYRDPITQVPFASMLAFNRMRQIYYFDTRMAHETVLLEDYATRATFVGAGGGSILCTPPVSATGISYVELHLETLGQFPHMHVGVCDGSFDVRSGWTALSDPHSALFATYNMKKHHGGHIEDFGTVAPKKGDRLGLMVDMSKGTLEVFLNDRPQGTLASNLPQPLYFCVDFGWPGQVVSIEPRDHWQMLSQCMKRFFEGLDYAGAQAKMMQLFKEFDLDGSDSIDISELNTAFHSMHVYMAEQELTELLAFVDEDDSGEIDFDEFSYMVNQIVAMGGDRRRMVKKGMTQRSRGASVVVSRPSAHGGDLMSPSNKEAAAPPHPLLTKQPSVREMAPRHSRHRELKEGEKRGSSRELLRQGSVGQLTRTSSKASLLASRRDSFVTPKGEQDQAAPQQERHASLLLQGSFGREGDAGGLGGGVAMQEHLERRGSLRGSKEASRAASQAGSPGNSLAGSRRGSLHRRNSQLSAVARQNSFRGALDASTGSLDTSVSLGSAQEARDTVLPPIASAKPDPTGLAGGGMDAGGFVGNTDC